MFTFRVEVRSKITKTQTYSCRFDVAKIQNLRVHCLWNGLDPWPSPNIAHILCYLCHMIPTDQCKVIWESNSSNIANKGEIRYNRYSRYPPRGPNIPLLRNTVTGGVCESPRTTSDCLSQAQGDCIRSHDTHVLLRPSRPPRILLFCWAFLDDRLQITGQ